MLLLELLEQLEVDINEEFKSKQQKKLFKSCSMGWDGPPCKSSSKRKWGKMYKEFKSKTSKKKLKNLPERVAKKK